MIKVVLDTNVVVSAHLSGGGWEDRVLKLVLHHRLQLCTSEPILAKYERVLKSPKFNLDPGRIARSLEEIRRTSNVVDPLVALSVSPDEADNRFLECAEAARAGFLVTGNIRHFPKHWKGTQVVTARHLIELVGR
jgi:putative PIN family toxin of toxin-antitoxin system